MKRLLSILITTYNRAYFLEKLLNSIVNNCNSFDKVELVIFNNGSTDNTEAIIEKFKNKIPYLVHERVKETLDFTGGFFRLAEIGSGTYFWYIGDDDFLIESIDDLVLFLEKELPEIILLNHKFYLQESSTDIENFIDKKDFLFYKRKNYYLDNYQSFIKNIKHINGFFTHIATCIFKKEEFKKLISEDIIEKYKKSRSHHIYLFLSILKNSSKIWYIHEQYICLRMGATYFEWATLGGRIERIKMGTKYFLEMVKDVFDEKEIISKFKRLILINDVLVLIVGAKLKLPNANIKYFFKIFKLLQTNFGNFPFFWYGIVPVLFAPAFILKIIYKIYMRLN